LIKQRYRAPNARYSKSHISPQLADITEIENKRMMVRQVHIALPQQKQKWFPKLRVAIEKKMQVSFL